MARSPKRKPHRRPTAPKAKPPARVCATRIRLATLDDVDDLISRSERIVGAEFSWEERVLDPANNVTLIAESGSGQPIGHINVSHPRLSQRIHKAASGFNPDSLPWWKLNSLGVEEADRRHGVATDLLAEAISRVPRGTLGLYGNVEPDHTEAIEWYRKRGFYLAAPIHLPLARHSANEAVISAGDDTQNIFFRGWLQSITNHLDVAQTPQEEESAANREREAEDRREQAARRAQGSGPFVRFRDPSVARRAFEQRQNGCLHMTLGPRPSVLLAYDPQHREVCTSCIQSTIKSIPLGSVADHTCDACGRYAPNAMQPARHRIDRADVVGGLCPDCRVLTNR